MVELKHISNNEILLELKDKVTPEEIENASKEIIGGPYRTVAIDCSKVYNLGHTVLGKLYMLKLDLSIRSKNLVIKGCSEKILNLFKMIRFDNLVQIVPDSPQHRRTDEAHQ